MGRTPRPGDHDSRWPRRISCTGTWRHDPYNKKGPQWILGRHTGADYAAPEGAECVAVLSGSIVRSGKDGSFGEFLVLRAGGFDFYYCHLSEKTVKGVP
ncbi:hypothetical protein SHKM778_56970 [Streptomyces sp. KM77-8]|uniref:M23ase beta-sheet core domain-containing protein n=1 Tax=Streptomyces haneummycinicus TaxID=3074435 RepID=A0AAT9HQ49_9ACTN